MRVPVKGVGRPGRDLRRLKRVSVPPPGPAPTARQHSAPPTLSWGQPGLIPLLWLILPPTPHPLLGLAKPGQWITGAEGHQVQDRGAGARRN